MDTIEVEMLDNSDMPGLLTLQEELAQHHNEGLVDFADFDIPLVTGQYEQNTVL